MSNAVRETLEFQGRSQRWLAGQLGMGESLLSKVLDGERSMPDHLPDRISVLLGVPKGLLFFDSLSGSLDEPTRNAAGATERSGRG